MLTTYIARTSDPLDTMEFDHAGDALDHIAPVLEDDGAASVWKVDLDEKGQPETIRNVTSDLIEAQAERLFEAGDAVEFVPSYAQGAFTELMAAE